MDIKIHVSDLIEALREVTEPFGNYDFNVPDHPWKEDMYSSDQIKAAKLIAQCVQIAKDHPDD